MTKYDQDGGYIGEEEEKWADERQGVYDHSEPSTIKRRERYYVDLGRAHDYLMRCKDCRRLVLFSKLQSFGSCSCGNKRVAEITTLTFWEWVRIRFGLLRFPDSEKFLKEFAHVK